jgi:autotransporter family porin
VEVDRRETRPGDQVFTLVGGVCNDPAMPMSSRNRAARALVAASLVVVTQLAPSASEPAAAAVTWQAGPLRSDAWCAARVKPRREVRPVNRPYNRAGAQRRLRQSPFRRVTGNFTGTTDQIIQWAACKWGFNTRALRAQAAIESYWTQTNLGDWTTDPTRCAPFHGIGADGRSGECPESVGLMQVRAPYFPWRVAKGAAKSTAYNLDAYLAVWRSCWRGDEYWLNHVERGRDYRAGDEWGCIGRWFTGRWYTPAAIEYVNRVKDYYRQRIWLTDSFRNWRP